MKQLFLFLLILVSAVAIAVAQDALPNSEDPELEKRLHNLSQELRCMVCQNETLAESRADLAVDLRNQIREQMKAGKTDKEIMEFLTARYGNYVRYNPPFIPKTYPLWVGSFVLLLGGFALLFRYIKQRRALIVDVPLTEDEHRSAMDLLGEQSGKGAA